MLRDLADRWSRDRIALAAAGVTYHWFLAIFPMLFAVVATIALAGNAVKADVVTSTINQVAPAGADAFLNGLVANAQSSANPQGVLAIVLAIVVALISTSSGMAALLQGIEVAAESPPRRFVRRRALAFALVIATLALAAAGVAVGVTAGALIDVPWVVTAVHMVLVVVVVAGALAAIWATWPTGTGPRRFWTVGSTFATLAIVVASGAMAVFATRFGGSFAHTYGVFANLVVLLLWFFVVALTVLVGAEIDAIRGRRSQPTAAGMDARDRKEDQMDTGTEETPNSFRCDLCGRTFDTQEQLRQHWDEEHADTPSVGATPRH
jgi:membrane protein